MHVMKKLVLFLVLIIGAPYSMAGEVDPSAVSSLSVDLDAVVALAD